MRLSTTINFFIAPYTQSFDACVDALEQYRDLGFSNLDAIFCGAENPGSPLRQDGWEDWVAAIGQAAQERGIGPMAVYTDRQLLSLTGLI